MSATTEEIKPLDRVLAARRQIEEQLEDLEAKIVEATDGERAASEEAIMRGEAPETSRAVALLIQRREELTRHLGATAPLEARLREEQAREGLERAEDEVRRLGEEAAEERKAADEANARLQDALNRVAWARDAVYTRRDQHARALQILAREDPERAAELAAGRAEDAGQITEEQMAQVRKNMAAMSGVYLMDSDEELAALRKAAADQGSTVTVFGNSAAGAAKLDTVGGE